MPIPTLLPLLAAFLWAVVGHLDKYIIDKIAENRKVGALTLFSALAGMPVAVTDISATCHMPDVIEAPYRPAMLGEVQDEEHIPVRLGGPSCLAGDVIGDYRLPVPCEPGQRFAFLDQAHYSMVKTNTFNGVQLPSIYLWDIETDQLELVKEFGYETFRDRLS